MDDVIRAPATSRYIYSYISLIWLANGQLIQNPRSSQGFVVTGIEFDENILAFGAPCAIEGHESDSSLILIVHDQVEL
jgi:hypothetical protein